ncbi:hypothetical protein BTUL_0095g00110 [Botrytis tulipae]|uniref:Uncharacterized protein n=1 Tax=Botrytis tulipae TaxID=87230 RepID=A0A4Z1ENU5_9HELO|nr:hypothetical protein BTUL_0095g00110 [Botrytis tulipae]
MEVRVRFIPRGSISTAGGGEMPVVMTYQFLNFEFEGAMVCVLKNSSQEYHGPKCPTIAAPCHREF